MTSAPQMQNFHRQRGFTLLEIMLAFVIFALVFAASLQVLTGALRNTGRSEDYSQAALWAQSKMDTVGIDPVVEEGSFSGEFENDYEWQMEISVYEPPVTQEGSGVLEVDVPVELYLVELTVMWGSDNQRRQARFQTLRSAIPDRTGI